MLTCCNFLFWSTHTTRLNRKVVEVEYRNYKIIDAMQLSSCVPKTNKKGVIPLKAHVIFINMQMWEWVHYG